MNKKLLQKILIFISPFIIFYLFIKILPYPELKEFLNKPYSLRIYDRKEQIIQILTLSDGTRREHIAINKIPQLTKKIFIKSEDKRFYFHFGVDPVAVIRSAFINFKQKRVVSGASTITMQLARLVNPKENNIKGKIYEAWNAIRIEAKLSKRKILELWLNSIPYGYRSIGIASASKTFFGKSVEELSTGEALALAIIPRRPEKYNPFTGRYELKKRCYELTKRISIKSSFEEISRDLSNIKEYPWKQNAFHFINYIRSQIQEKEFIKGDDIITSINLELNNRLQNILRYYLDRYEKFRVSNGAILIIDNSTGEIITYIGSNDFQDKENSGEIDGIHTKNQPGSALKPFLYALALENGFTPGTILPDIPLDFGDENLYFPLNFNRRFNGPVRLRVALASSLNVPAVYLVSRLGVQRFAELLIDLDFDSLLDQRSTLGTGIALGNAEISLYELTRGFSIFPRGGQKNTLTFRKVKDKKFIKGDKIFTDYTASLICDILSDNSSRVLGFGPNSMLNTKFPTMFKTGTSNQFNNVWAIGATTDYTVGVWAGNFSGETVVGLTGNSIPVFICVEALKILNENSKIEKFPLSENVIEYEICPLSGQLKTENCPSSVREYFRKDVVVKKCEFHVKEKGRVVLKYPSIYANWALSKDKDFMPITVNNNDSYPKIIRPNDNSIFFYDPNVPAINQAIRVDIIHDNNDEELKLIINNSFKKFLKYPYQFYFNIKRGKWIIEVQSKNGGYKIEIIVK